MEPTTSGRQVTGETPLEQVELELEPSQSGGDGSHPAPFQRGQQLALVEAMAESLLEAALKEALEVHLRRQLEEEAARSALATGDAKQTRGAPDSRLELEEVEKLVEEELEGKLDEETKKKKKKKKKFEEAQEEMIAQGETSELADADEDETSELSSLRARLSFASDQRASQADDEYDANDEKEDEDDDEDTLNGAHLRPGGSGEPERRSLSPSRFDGRHLFEDLKEISNCADRIDQLLEGSISSHSARSESPFERAERLREAELQNYAGDDEQEVD